jgi:hypothetical protein
VAFFVAFFDLALVDLALVEFLDFGVAFFDFLDFGVAFFDFLDLVVDFFVAFLDLVVDFFVAFLDFGVAFFDLDFEARAPAPNPTHISGISDSSLSSGILLLGIGLNDARFFPCLNTDGWGFAALGSFSFQFVDRLRCLDFPLGCLGRLDLEALFGGILFFFMKREKEKKTRSGHLGGPKPPPPPKK